ncbi:MAG: phenylalanine--tRNA ligase subunit alpha, partial [Myxococcota bacterium]
MSDALKAFEEGLDEVEATYREVLAGAADESALRAANAKLVGPEGRLTKLLKLMKSVPGDRRKDLGQRSNALKNAIKGLFEGQLEALAKAAREAELTGPALDVTLPGRRPLPGRLHPITRIKHELMDGFTSLGFDIADGPESDTHETCFD